VYDKRHTVNLFCAEAIRCIRVPAAPGAGRQGSGGTLASRFPVNAVPRWRTTLDNTVSRADSFRKDIDEFLQTNAFDEPHRELLLALLADERSSDASSALVLICPALAGNEYSVEFAALEAPAVLARVRALTRPVVWIGRGWKKDWRLIQASVGLAGVRV
jgi:hypothetical protein